MSSSLPIDAIKSDLFSAFDDNNMLILSAPPGAGKSTRLPLWLLESERFANKKIYLLQPRRVAAKNIASFLAQQLGEQVGASVGYRLRNDVKVSSKTRLEVITEGILTQLIQNDPELTDCAMVILDEFHERSLHADLAFALSRDIQQSLREDLIILLMSATLTHGELIEQLPDAHSLTSEGKAFPVDISYQAPKQQNDWREHACQVVKLAVLEHQGSILVFLPGIADIHYLMEKLAVDLPNNKKLSPLYGGLSLNEQQQAIAPAPLGIDKVVLTTNIAETSLTIEGINLVIDSGLEKVAKYDPQSLTNALILQNIAKSSCIQRAGRAGRLMAGKCIRLFSKEDFMRRQEQATPEIEQADILPLMIEAARWGVSQLVDLPLLQYPSKSREQITWQELVKLSIVDKKHRLTAHGKGVSQLSCHPRFAHMIIKSVVIAQQYDISQLTPMACILAALLEERDLLSPQQAQLDVDIRHRLHELAGNSNKNRYIKKSIVEQANKLQKQIEKIGSNEQINIANVIDKASHYCGELLAIAYPERIAKQRNKSNEYVCENGKGVIVNREDPLANTEYLSVAQVGASPKHRNLMCRLAAPVDMDRLAHWQIIKLASVQKVFFDTQKDKLRSIEQHYIGAIVLDEKPSTKAPSANEIAEVWCQQVTKHGLNWLNWRDSDHELRNRWQWLNLYQPQLALAKIDDESLLASLTKWFSPFVTDVKSKQQLLRLSVSDMLLSMLSYQDQQLITQLAPSYFIGPTGRKCPIRYSEEKSPTVSLPMQELYGVVESPCVGEKGQEIPLVLEILSPAQRPIQVTKDLKGFWQGSYKQVQKDMKSRYPKHYWPDDPANAVATNKTKRHVVHVKSQK